jgi:anti-sigma B factor antagonist
VSEHSGSGDPLLIQVSGDGAARCLLVRVHGEIDLATAPVLERRLDALIRRRIDVLVVDLSEVPFCDVSGLNALLRVQADLRTRGGRLRVLGPCQSLGRMLSVLGLNDGLPVEEAAGRDGAGQDGAGFGG